MGQRFRFEHYEFEPESGLLVHAAGKGEGHKEGRSTRLAPQPSRLLELLLSRYPEMVSRELIRETLWPEVQVDFERSLHYCIRQVRSALGESASDPQYIETIPRRGYRWLLTPQLEGELSTIASADESPETTLPSMPVATTADVRDPSESRIDGEANASRGIATDSVDKSRSSVVTRRGILVTASLILVGVTLFLTWQTPTEPGDSRATRIAIMPWLPPVGGVSGFTDNHLAEQMLADLMAADPRLEVIGPTTTQSYDSPQRLRALVEELNIDYVLNGRFSSDARVDRVLAEIIRADGAHVWTHYFTPEQRQLIPQMLVTKVLELAQEMLD